MSKPEPYRVDVALPGGYEHGTDRYPLLLFLHGSGERGNDLEVVRRHGPPKLVLGAFRPLYLDPFIIVSPQCPAGEEWSAEALIAVFDGACATWRVDPARVYLTGLSLGGLGAWRLAIAQPERFAAVAPICGRADPALAARLENVPIWIFHSAADQVVPAAESDRMFEALVRCNADVTYTRYRRLGHAETWEAAYGQPMLYEWLLQHELRVSQACPGL
ncbi:MAG: PHB depolymerase family esterase [Gammaproteobacteria bacterium]|jgi:predicted peptidase